MSEQMKSSGKDTISIHKPTDKKGTDRPAKQVFVGIGKAASRWPEKQAQWLERIFEKHIYPKLTLEQKKKSKTEWQPTIKKYAKAGGWLMTGGEVIVAGVIVRGIHQGMRMRELQGSIRDEFVRVCQAVGFESPAETPRPAVGMVTNIVSEFVSRRHTGEIAEHIAQARTAGNWEDQYRALTEAITLFMNQRHQAVRGVDAVQLRTVHFIIGQLWDLAGFVGAERLGIRAHPSLMRNALILRREV